MLSKQMKTLTVMIIMIGFAVPVLGQSIYFEDDFEKGLGKWDLVNADKIKIVDTAETKHGKALCLHTGGEAVYALIKDSDAWTNIKVEGDVFFPWNTCSYLGLIYNYNVRGPRVDFGSIFILGPFGEDLVPYFTNIFKHMEWPPDHFLGNVIWVNPHRDSNASRNIYSEYWVTLTDDTKAIKPGEWGHFKAEIVGPACHFYVTDMETPTVTYNFFEFSSGRVGFKPRYTGAEVWIDNIKVTPLKEFSYKGPGLPAGRTYKPKKLLTNWKAIGPFSRRIKEIETQGYHAEKSYTLQNQTYKWEPFETDPRGCVVTGKLTHRFNYHFFAYFLTEINSQNQKEVTIEFSSTNTLVLWVNNKLVGNVKRQFVCWYDFWENPEHKGETTKATLNPGKNSILVLVKGGRYGGDGFYAYCHMNPPKDKEDDKKPGKK
ncbi:MAG: hypothetical protein JSV88_04250 [Candidatus Aminicenantes bacterium]|nr:MAG: hypothetical protein JSV88_04250 [Candidatus Aminicenantes bacterium]